MATEGVFEGWAILELMGHRRLGGYVRSVELAGVGLFRIDVPAAGSEDMTTQFYAPSALYCLTPTTEELVREFARRNQPEPVHRWELPAPAPVLCRRCHDYRATTESGLCNDCAGDDDEELPY